jgi:hypothetical protein
MRLKLIVLVLIITPLVHAQCSVTAGQSVICTYPFLSTTIPNPSPLAGIAYSSGNLVANGSGGSVTWTLVSGAATQNGLTMNVGSTASITGTPTSGNCSWTVKWQDATGNNFTGPVNVSISTLLGINATPLTANVNKSTTLQYSAKGNYSNGSLPDITSIATWNLPGGTGCTGSSVNSTGLFTAGTTVGNCTVQAAFGGQNGQATATVTSASGTPTIQNTDPLPNGQINQPYSSKATGTNGSQGIGQGVQMTATGGTAPYTWNVQTGT